MRILHLVSYSLYSGPLPSTAGLACAQQALGHEVWLAYDMVRGAFNDFEEPAAPRIAALPLNGISGLSLSAKSGPAALARDIWRLNRFVRQHHIDVVHTHLSHDHILAMLAGRPDKGSLRIRTFHAERSLTPRWGQKQVTQAADGWIVRCTRHAEMLARHFDVPADRLASICGGIDPTAFVPPTPEQQRQARAHFGFSDNRPVVGQVALIANRGQHELVAAAEQLGSDGPYVLIAGRGEGENRLKERIARSPAQSRIRLAGYLQGADLNLGYAAMDAAFCAQAGNDASARAALEAMASGLPVIGVATGALGEMVNDTVGYPVASREPDAIAIGLRGWLANPHQGQSLGQRARAWVVRERSFEREAEQTLAHYKACAPLLRSR